MSHLNIHTTPALKPPKGQTSDLIHAFSLQPHLIATSAVCLSLSVSAVLARTFTKAWILKKVEVEDYALMLSTLGFAAFTGVMIEAGEAGQGKHQWNVSIGGLQRIALLANILEIIYPPTMFAAKFAILQQIKRIFTQHQRNFHYWAVQIIILLNGLVYLALLFAFIFACMPREKIWEPLVEGRCISTNGSIIATSVINIISDFSILFLPLINIVRLRLPLQKKLGVGAVFATGLFACIASIIRLVYSVRLTRTEDITWAIAPVGMWALAEFVTVILVGCFPTIPRLWKYLRGKEPGGRSEYSPSKEERPKSSKAAKIKQPTTSTKWSEGALDSSFGPYIPLQERTFSVSCENAELAKHSIYKTTDIDLTHSSS